MKTLWLLTILVSTTLLLGACASTEEQPLPDDGAPESVLDQEILGESDDFGSTEDSSDIFSDTGSSDDLFSEEGATIPEPEPTTESDYSMNEEETISEPIAEPQTTPIATPSKRDKDAMRRLVKNCNMRSAPNFRRGTVIKSLPRGRKIWTEHYDARFFKIYRKAGHAFVSKTCF